MVVYYCLYYEIRKDTTRSDMLSLPETNDFIHIKRKAAIFVVKV